MKKVKTFAHCGNTGDVIASLPALKEFYRKTGEKPILYLVKDHPAEYYEGATHPVVDSNGQTVSLNETMINLLTPLLKYQDYLEDVSFVETSEYGDAGIDINLSAIRDTFCNIPYGDIRRWYFYIYPDLACNLAPQYLNVPTTDRDLAKGKIIISRSERYTNPHIDYSFLKKYEEDILFCGTMREYNNFTMTYDLEIQKLAISDFLEYAQAISQSKMHISNQTMAFQISEGLKHSRIVELCSFAPNVVPVGENAFDFYAQAGLEYYVDYLFKLK